MQAGMLEDNLREAAARGPIIIAMTASAMRDDRNCYLKVMDDFISKVSFFNSDKYHRSKD